MKKLLSSTVGVGAIITMFGLFVPATSNAGVNINITVPLPGLVIPAPPGLVVVPGTYVYYPPDVEADIFFYHGYWYRPYGGGWYTANGYNGPWRSVGPGRVPPALINLPGGYRRFPPEHQPVPYGHVRKNWRNWENERYWDNGDEHERGEHGHGRGHGHGKHRD